MESGSLANRRGDIGVLIHFWGLCQDWPAGLRIRDYTCWLLDQAIAKNFKSYCSKSMRRGLGNAATEFRRHPAAMGYVSMNWLSICHRVFLGFWVL